tara:strand:- start:14590 stop:15393 length:804 start_codon:yes stop_codon:yes gene_type:complete
MPELAELKFTADFINEASKGQTYIGVQKNPIHKCEDIDAPWFQDKQFTVTSESRGKELIVWMHCDNVDLPIQMTMGMTGHFKVTTTGHEPKHAHLKFYRKNGTTLSFVDVRRFGKWKAAGLWNDKRGPDPTKEFKSFKENILVNINKAAFNHPIYLLLMNQKYFNGIGNYLRAEILYRLPYLNPFLSAREAILEEPKILELCRDIPNLAYVRGGGRIKDWKNPFGKEPGRFMKCYGNDSMLKIKDKNARMFWYDPKWEGFEKTKSDR